MEGGLTETLASSALDLESLGSAYIVFLASMVLSAAAFTASRMWLVVTPNRPAKDYGLYIVVVLVSLGIAATLESELVPDQATTLQYAMFPQLVVLVALHLWIYYDQQPWLVAAGASSIVASMAVVSIGAVVVDRLHLAHWLTITLLTVLLGYLSYFSISTKRGFLKARSIYVDSKETFAHRSLQQTPWLGLPQWVALISASILLAMINAALQGRGIADIPAVGVFTESMLMLVITCLVCAIPATTYWFAHKHWMPELTRFVWLVWIVVGFAFTYGNFLTSLDRP
jgi:hypothetical protein